MSPKRLDAADSVDTATHLLHRLQSDGWVVDSIQTDCEYHEAKEGAPKLPIRNIVTIALVPGRG